MVRHPTVNDNYTTQQLTCDSISKDRNKSQNVHLEFLASPCMETTELPKIVIKLSSYIGYLTNTIHTGSFGQRGRGA